MTLKIRPLLAADAASLHAIRTHPDVARHIGTLPVAVLEETRSLLADHEAGQNRLVAELAGRTVGYVELTQFQRPRRMHSAGIMMMVDPAHWGQGIGGALMAAALDLADNWLNLTRIDAGLLEDNVAAQHLCVKFGFELEGRRRQAVVANGRLADELVFGRIRDGAVSATLVEPPPFTRRRDIAAIYVRPRLLSDAVAIHSLTADPAVARGLNQIPSLELTDIEHRLASNALGLYRLTAVARLNDGSEVIAGNIGLHQPLNPRLWHSAGFGLSVAREYWGVGVGAALLAAIIDLADNWLNLARLELEVYADNAPAIRLYQRHGFEIEGTRRLYSYGDGHWSDAYFMSRLGRGSAS